MFFLYEQISISYISFFLALTDLSNSIWQGMLLVDHKKKLWQKAGHFHDKSRFWVILTPLGQWKKLNFLQNFSIISMPISKGNHCGACHIQIPILRKSLHLNAYPKFILGVTSGSAQPTHPVTFRWHPPTLERYVFMQWPHVLLKMWLPFKEQGWSSIRV